MKVFAPGSYGNSIGTSKFVIDAVSKKIEKIETTNSFAYADELDPSKKIIELYQNNEKQFQSDLDQVVGKSNNGLTTTSGGESPLGNLISDIMRSTTEEADFAFILPSLIRNHFPKGDLKDRHIYDAIPTHYGSTEPVVHADAGDPGRVAFLEVGKGCGRREQIATHASPENRC